MPTENIDEKTLNKNGIKNFVLKVDLIKNDDLDLGKIAEKMSQYFDRTEKRQVSNFTINFTNVDSELSKISAFDYVLVSEPTNVAMTFSEIQNSFWLEATNYKNNVVYKDLIRKVSAVIKSLGEEVEAKRIGMRYINEFECKKASDISRIFGKRLSSILKTILKENNQIRAIGMEEYSNEELKLRLQYGVPNKFYPSSITTYDLLLDIDSYTESNYNVNDWESIISKLNHSAYELFLKEMNEIFIGQLK